MEVQALRIGELCMVAMGGEISCEIGLEVKERIADRKVWTMGYSNLLRCYVASLGAHDEGGYALVASTRGRDPTAPARRAAGVRRLI